MLCTEIFPEGSQEWGLYFFEILIKLIVVNSFKHFRNTCQNTNWSIITSRKALAILYSGESSASFSWSGNDSVLIEPFIRGVNGIDISSVAMLSNYGGTWSHPGLFLGFNPFKTSSSSLHHHITLSLLTKCFFDTNRTQNMIFISYVFKCATLENVCILFIIWFKYIPGNSNESMPVLVQLLFLLNHPSNNDRMSKF